MIYGRSVETELRLLRTAVEALRDAVLTETRASRREVMGTLSDIQTEVSETSGVVQSAVVLIDSLADQLEGASNDPAAIDAIVADLRAQRDELAAAVESPGTEATTEPGTGEPGTGEPGTGTGPENVPGTVDQGSF